MNSPFLDLDLLRSFVSVVDSGGFTRAGERVHRTQSTVSQQIRKLEVALGEPVLVRLSRGVRVTELGERLLGYARRILALADEARDVLIRPGSEAAVRLGLDEDFATDQLTRLLSEFARAHPGVRLHIECGLSTDLMRALDRGDLEILVATREPGDGPCVAAWPEQLHWVASAQASCIKDDPLPLVVFPQGCLYRNRAIHALEARGRRWRIAFSSSSLVSVQAAVSAGLGVTLLSEAAMCSDHRILRETEGFSPVSNTELVLRTGELRTPGARTLANYLIAVLTEGGLRHPPESSSSNRRLGGGPLRVGHRRSSKSGLPSRRVR